MSTAAASSSMPSGRHEVKLGTSFIQALKARKGAPANSKHIREFYSVRYHKDNFKPESIDVDKAGTVEVEDADDGKMLNIKVSRPGAHDNEQVRFKGRGTAVRETECVLIYDEETGTFTLEKLDTCFTLTHDYPHPSARRAASPAPPRASASTSASTLAQRQEEEESEGEIPESKPPPKQAQRPATTVKAKPQTTAPLPPTRSLPSKPTPSAAPKNPSPAPTPAPPKSKPIPTASTNATQVSATVKPRRPPGPITRPAPKLQSKGPTGSATSSMPTAAIASTPAGPSKSPNKRELPTEPDTETLEVRRPPPKKLKLAPKKEPVLPPPKQPAVLSFPDMSSVVSMPPPLPSSTPTASAAAPKAPEATPAAALTSTQVASLPDDSEDEDWDEVQPPATAAATAAPLPPPMHAIVMEEIEPSAFTPLSHSFGGAFSPPPRPQAAAEDVEMDLLELALTGALAGDEEPEQEQEQDEEEDDWLLDAVAGSEPSTAPEQPPRRPVSLNQYVQGEADYGDEDDYSSSEDSEDD